MNSDFYKSILSGEFDDSLDSMAEAIRDRRNMLSRMSFYTWEPGMKAQLQNLSPKYMIGAYVTVVSRKRERIVVDIDPDFMAGNYRAVKRFGSGKGVTVTPSMLKEI